MKAILCETFWGFLGGGVRILIWLKIVHLTNFVNLMGSTSFKVLNDKYVTSTANFYAH